MERRDDRARLNGALATWGAACVLLALTGEAVEVLGVRLPRPAGPRGRLAVGLLGVLVLGTSAILWFLDRRKRRAAAADEPTFADPPRSRAAQVTRPVHTLCQLPRDIDDFTGREDLVERVSQLLAGGRQHSGTVAIAAVDGLGGVGKTTLAVHVAHRLGPAFPDGQLYVNLRGVEAVALSPLRVLGDLLLALGVEPDAIPDTLEERALRYRALLAERRMLVVLDNARDEGQVRPLLPGSATCATVITSRTRLSGLEGVETVDLSVLELHQAVALFTSIVGRERVEAEYEAATRIGQLCGCLPLAVRIAGAKLAAKPHWRLADLVARLGDEHRRLEEFKVGDLGVRASFALSYEGMPAGGRRLFRLLGVLDVPDFPGWVAAALMDTTAASVEDLLEGLVGARLLEVTAMSEASGDRYRFHDLLRDYSRELLRDTEPEAAQRAALERVLGAYLDLARVGFTLIRPGDPAEFPDRTPGPWRSVDEVVGMVGFDHLAWFAQEHANLLAAIQQAHDNDVGSVTWELACAFRPFLNWKGLWSDWTYTHTLGLQSAGRVGDLRGQATILRHLGHAYEEQDRWDEALRYFRESVDRYTQIGDRLGRACAQWSTGYALHAQGRLVEAADLFELCLPVFRELDVRQWSALALDRLALVHRDNGRFADALNLLRESRVLLERIKDHYWLARATADIGGVYLEQGRIGHALDYLQRSHTVFTDFGDRHHAGGVTVDIGRAHLARGDAQVALDCFMRARRVLDDFDNRHLRAVTNHCIGLVARHQGRQEDALGYFEGCVPAFEEFRDRRWQIRNSLVLAELYLERGDATGATKLLDNCLSTAAETSSPLWRATVLRSRATALQKQGQHLAATEAIRMAESIVRGHHA